MTKQHHAVFLFPQPDCLAASSKQVAGTMVLKRSSKHFS